MTRLHLQAALGVCVPSQRTVARGGAGLPAACSRRRSLSVVVNAAALPGSGKGGKVRGLVGGNRGDGVGHGGKPGGWGGPGLPVATPAITAVPCAKPTRAQVLHCMRHGITEMNAYLKQFDYDAADFKDPLMWVAVAGRGAPAGEARGREPGEGHCNNWLSTCVAVRVFSAWVRGRWGPGHRQLSTEHKAPVGPRPMHATSWRELHCMAGMARPPPPRPTTTR